MSGRGDVSRLLGRARAAQTAVRMMGGVVPTVPAPVPASPSPLQLYDLVVSNPGVREASRRLFADGHHASAVEEAFKYLNNAVKTRSGLKDIDGSSLMEQAFSPANGSLRMNALDSVSQRDQQLGYMKIFAGSMTGIRNPRAHEHAYIDGPEVAIELLGLANHLARMLDLCKRRRRR